MTYNSKNEVTTAEDLSGGTNIMDTNSHVDTVSGDSDKQEHIQATSPDVATEASEFTLDTDDPPGWGFENDLLILTHIINQNRFGTSVEPANYRQRLYDGGRKHCFEDLEVFGGDGDELRTEMLAGFNAFADELLQLHPPTQDRKPLGFERWLKQAGKKYIRKYHLEEYELRFLFETEWWGLTPTDGEERRIGVPLTRLELSEFGADLSDGLITEREFVPSGRNELKPFQPKGGSLTAPESWMLRRLGILPTDWDRIYGGMVERTADEFCRFFYPVFRWAALDPHDEGIFIGERVEAELMPGFEALFATFLHDALTVAVNQTVRYALAEAPGTGPGMRAFECRILRPPLKQVAVENNDASSGGTDA